MSNQPPEYTRQYNFENFQTINPTSPLPGNKVEAELNAARSSINQTISRLNEIQNADGSLKTPGALATETTATATSVATSVATTTAQAYLAANYDPTIATQALASASSASISAASASNSAITASGHAVNSESAAQNSVNAAIDSSIARSQARAYAIDANQSRNEAHASAVSAANSYANVGQVYNSALSLKNWIDSESYQFIHKKEDLSDFAANMLFNDGEVENTLIGKVFLGASVGANSDINYAPPVSGGPGNLNIFSGPWWVNGHPSPEAPHRIVMRDMLSCLVDTWMTFGPRVGSGYNLKQREEGVNGSPNTALHTGPERIKGVNYSKDGFGIGLFNGSEPLTPKGYVDYGDSLLSTRIDGKANVSHTHSISDVTNLQSSLNSKSNTGHTHSISEVSGLQTAINDAKLKEYDNYKVYSAGDVVISGNKIYKFNTFIGAAGYGPVTHPSAWTEVSSSADLTGYATESFVTSQGYISSIPSEYVKTSASGSGSNELKQSDFDSIKNSGWIDTVNGVPASTVTIQYVDGTGSNYQSEVHFEAPALYHNSSVILVYGGNVGDYALISNVWNLYLGNNAQTLQGYSITFNNGINVSVNNGSPYSSTSELHGVTATLMIPKSKGTEFVYNEELLIETNKLASKSGATFTGKINTVAPTTSNAGLNIGTINSTANLTNSIPGDVWIGTWQMTYKTANGTLVYGAATNASNVFGSPQVIDTTSNTMPGLRVTQKGTQPCLVVEDSLNPDTTAFVVDTSGNVGIGVAAGYSATSKLEVVGNVKSTTLSTGSGPTFSLNSTGAHTGGSDTLDAIVTINGVNYRIGLRPA